MEELKSESNNEINNNTGPSGEHREDSSPPSEARTLDPYIIEILKPFIDQMNYLSRIVIGREEVILQAMYALLLQEHILLLGRTGMAKSYMANCIFSIFNDIKVFSTQASKDQTPDNYFGPYNIEEFKKGVIRHNIRNSILEADLVFLDEFFDASDIVLRSLLSVLNERKFINGPEIVDAKIHTAIATANYMRLNEVTEAVLDRFIFKSVIPEGGNMYKQLLIDHSYKENKGQPVKSGNRIPFSHVKLLSGIVRNVNNSIHISIPDSVLFMKNVIINNFTARMKQYDPAFFISPRKQAKIADLLRASALLDGRNEAMMEDLKKMHLSVCTLNSGIPGSKRDKSEKDLFHDSYEQTMVHFNAMGAMNQIEYLLLVRNIFKGLLEDPEKFKQIKRNSGILHRVKNLFKGIFTAQTKFDEDMSVSMLKDSIIKLKPSLMEVQELKEGILIEFRDLNV